MSLLIFLGRSEITAVELSSIGDKVVIRIHQKYYRPNEVEFLLGDASKAADILDWTPTHDLVDIIKDMFE